MINKKGVTIVELVIIIILLLLIASFAILSTRTTNIEAEATALYSEMDALHRAIILVNSDYNYGIINEIEEGKYYSSKDDEWCKVYGISNSNYSQEIINNLGLDELKRTYLVNFETGEIKLENPEKIGEYIIETYKEMKTIIESGAL